MASVAVPCGKCGQVHRSEKSVIMVCVKCGTIVSITVGGQPTPSLSEPSRWRKSRLVKWVELFRTPTDRGLGDTVERLLAKAGGRKIKAALERLKIDCGCGGRQADLNEKYPY